MRILVVHNQLWAHYKSVLFQEIHHVLSEQYPDSELLVAQIALHEKSRKSMTTGENSIPYKYPYLVLFQKSLDSITFVERLRALFKVYHEYKPDVLNITGYFDFAQVLLLLYARLQGIKTVISSESSAVDKPRSGLKEAVKKLILKQSDAFFCFGSTTRNYLKALGVPDKKIVIKKAAVVDNERILRVFEAACIAKTGTDNPAFIYVGRLAPEKNLLRLIQAFEMLRKNSNFEKWGLILVGEGPERNELEKYVHDNSLEVNFVGGVGWTEVPQWLAKATVLVLPSTSEPWGLVVNEAMLCGMPVIVSENCGCAEDLVQPGSNGFAINPQDVGSLASAMQYYMENPSAVEAHGTESKKRIIPFSPKEVAQEMARAYHSLPQ
jgi:glycosyltransferase involved in cell wall biosynthesis